MEKRRLINFICSQIVKIRKEKGLMQNELKNITSIKQASILRLKKENMNEFPTIEFLNEIANRLNKKLVIKFE